MQPHLSMLTAFLAGLVSFVSPCVLPLVPSYLSFLTGTSLEDLQTTRMPIVRARVLAHALAFVSGFTLIFVCIGLSASTVGSLFASNKELIARIGGVVIVVLGLQMLGVFRIPLLMMDKRIHRVPRKQSFAMSFLVGIGFAAGWSPCIGPILSAIIVLAANERIAQAAFLLFCYSMGLALPFLVTAAAVAPSLTLLGRVKKLIPVIEAGSGILLVVTGIVLASDSFTRVAGFLYRYLPKPGL